LEIKSKIHIESIHLITSSLNKFLIKNSIKESDLLSIQSLLDILLRIIPLPQYNCIPAQLERLTINETIPPFKNEKLRHIKDIKYPPKEVVKKYGRCNVLNQSILYGAFHMITAIEEMKPEVGKFVTHTEWKIKENMSLRMFPIFFITQGGKRGHNSLSLEIKDLHEEYKSGFSQQDQDALDMAMEFLAKCFSKDIERTNHFDYFLSAYISKKIFEINPIGYEGIIYPSVQSKLAFSNMAIRPEVFEEKFILSEIRHEMNIVQPGRNGINYVSSRSQKFDQNTGLIVWDD